MSTDSAPAPSEWDLVIKPHTRWWDLPLADVWRYRDLLWLFVRRDFVSVYISQRGNCRLQSSFIFWRFFALD